MDKFSFWGDNPGPLIPRNSDIPGENGIPSPGDNLPKFYVAARSEQLHIVASKALKLLAQTLQGNYDFSEYIVKELFQTAYFDMIIEDFSEQSSEAVQVTKTIGGNIVRTYFNQNPKTLEIRGKLLNTLGDDWYTKLSFYYNHILRGTLMTQIGAWIVFDMIDRKYYGTFDGLQISKRAGTEQIVDFAMTFSVEKEEFKIIESTSFTKFSSSTPNAKFWVENGYASLIEQDLVTTGVVQDDIDEARESARTENLKLKTAKASTAITKNNQLYQWRKTAKANDTKLKE